MTNEQRRRARLNAGLSRNRQVPWRETAMHVLRAICGFDNGIAPLRFDDRSPVLYYGHRFSDRP